MDVPQLGERDEFEDWKLDELPPGPEYHLYAKIDLPEYKPYEKIGEEPEDDEGWRH